MLDITVILPTMPKDKGAAMSLVEVFALCLVQSITGRSSCRVFRDERQEVLLVVHEVVFPYHHIAKQLGCKQT